MARCLSIEANFPKIMWTYAVMASVYIRNRCFNSRLGKTPYEALTGSKPNLSNMHVFGSVCFAYVQKAKKLDPRSKEEIFVGYDKRSPASLVYFPETNKVERVRCVKLFGATNLEGESPAEEEGEYAPSVLPSVDKEPDAGKEGENSDTTERIEGTGNTRYPTRIRSKPTYLHECVTDKVVDDAIGSTVDSYQLVISKR